jgi:hypothetical protein
MFFPACQTTETQTWTNAVREPKGHTAWSAEFTFIWRLLDDNDLLNYLGLLLGIHGKLLLWTVIHFALRLKEGHNLGR